MTGTLELLRERLLRRPGRKAYEPGVRVIHSIGPLGELVSEPGDLPTHDEAIRSAEEIRAARVVSEVK